MSPSQIRSYSRTYSQYNSDATDFLEIIQKIPTLTKIGALCLVMGKFMGVMAIMVAFIPELNVLVAPLVMAWGGFVFIAIILCSTDHFRQKKSAGNMEKQTVTSELETDLIRKQAENEIPVTVIPLIIGQN